MPCALCRLEIMRICGHFEREKAKDMTEGPVQLSLDLRLLGNEDVLFELNTEASKS